MKHIFLSYNREDQHRARAIADALREEGFSVWWDTDLKAGESYDEVTEKHLREAGAVVVLWSTRSVNSKWVRAEATVGERFSKLVPAMIEPCERPLRFELVQTADLVSWHGDRTNPNWRGFTQAVRNALGHDDKPAAAPAAVKTAAPAGGGVPDVTIENTFWTSIKDGNDAAEFEAYLKRYPEGHFADLARNRLAAIARHEAADEDRAQRAREAEDARRAQEEAAARRAEAERRADADRRAREAAARLQQQSRAEAPAQQRSRPAPSRPAPQQAARAPAPSPEEKKSPVAAIAIGAVAVAVLGGGAFLFLGKGGDDSSRAEPTTVVAQASEPAESQPAAASTPSDAIEPTAADATIAEDALDPGAAEPDALDALQDDLSRLAGDAPVENAAAAEAEPVVEAAATGPFRDCDDCPQMIAIDGGTFLMGSPDDEPGREPYEGPQREVTIEPFAIGVSEVTQDEWMACVADGGCNGYEPGDAGFGGGDRPALFISWNDAQAYVRWLAKTTGKPYRLPSEAEWEYAARAGAAGRYWWGDRFDAKYTASGAAAPVGSLGANEFGLTGVLGNAREWVADCYVSNFNDAPTDGSPAQSGDCERRVQRGGDWRSDAKDLRLANRVRVGRDVRDRRYGFRVAMDLD